MDLPPDLPRPSDRRVAVTVSPDALRQIRGGHPWVFDASIRATSRDGAPGDLAVIFGHRREFVAIGLWDPTSPIRLRILHHGRPAAIDQSFWRSRLSTAIGRRAGLLADPATTGIRLVHGENDALSALVVDHYDTTAVVKLYSAAWFPHLGDVLDALLDAATGAGVPIERVVLRFSRNIADSARGVGLMNGSTVLGAASETPVLFLENGLRFEADVVAGQKTGHFLDQRANRAKVGRMAEGRRVLDVFACTGGFSLHAAAGGATEVDSVDLSRRSLATAEANFAHNQSVTAVRAARHNMTVGDAFDVLDALTRSRRRYGMVVVDPPSFAQKAQDRPRAIAAYHRLAEAGLGLVEDGGFYVQSSCSSRVNTDEFREAVLGAHRAAGRRVRILDETAHAVDHPIDFVHGAYLKTIFLQVEHR